MLTSRARGEPHRKSFAIKLRGAPILCGARAFTIGTLMRDKTTQRIRWADEFMYPIYLYLYMVSGRCDVPPFV